MHSIYQRLEFTYDYGEHFWDRSGRLAFELRKMMPGLRVKRFGPDQRDMVDDGAQRELFFGIAAASIVSTHQQDEAFIPLAAGFLRELASNFEVEWLQDFTYRLVIGRRCATPEEAHALFGPLVGKDAQEKLKAMMPDGHARAFQAEFRQGPIDVSVRFAILDLASDPTMPSELHPYIGAVVEVRGNEPILIAEFDSEAFMTNVATQQMNQILERMAPHLL